MAVGANQLALGYLLQNSLPGSSPVSHVRDALLLLEAREVIEVHHVVRKPTAAVSARLVLQPLDLVTVLFAEPLPFRNVVLLVRGVIPTMPVGRTLDAVALVATERPAPGVETRDGLHLPARPCAPFSVSPSDHNAVSETTRLPSTHQRKER